ncbi:MAG TPA: hypothetical protein VEU95_12795, partial [Micropepsaceae bacterium]|nr:hypothetical protein [Micropepsaceae bacterium]
MSIKSEVHRLAKLATFATVLSGMTLAAAPANAIPVPLADWQLDLSTFGGTKINHINYISVNGAATVTQHFTAGVPNTFIESGYLRLDVANRTGIPTNQNIQNKLAPAGACIDTCAQYFYYTGLTGFFSDPTHIKFNAGSGSINL